MRVLGISPLDKDATVSFLEDGHVLFACGEERLSRVKMQDGFPQRALELGLQRTGWETGSIDAVAYAFFDGAEEARLMREAYAADGRRHGKRATATSLERLREATRRPYQVDRSKPIPGFSSPAQEFMPAKAWHKRAAYDLIAGSPLLDWVAHRRGFRAWVKTSAAEHARWTTELDAGLRRFGLAGKLRRFHHHDAHAANAFFASGFDEALIVTLDGYGSGTAGGIYRGDRSGVQALHRYPFPSSLGLFYEHVTAGLGFRISRHEGKIVGLAAYGDPELLGPVLRARFATAEGDIVMKGAFDYYLTRALAGRFAKRDVAAAYQRVLEEVATASIAHWRARTGLSRVALSGGVNANVKLNQRIREIPGVEEVFVYPNMGDGGLATGAAMLLFPPECFHGRPLANVYHGPDFTEAEARAALEQAGLSPRHADNIEEEIAGLLTQQRIVGRCAGRMEYGPRALGNRSILYPAQDPHVNQWLNQQLGRTEFMPFAPVCLAEEAGRLFRNLEGCHKTAEFMTITFDCTEEMKKSCPAAVHVDGTARPQLVSASTNASFYRVLEAYHRKTGVPAIINTSFNMHEEPIVCSPGDAVRAFLQGRLDYLALGNFLVPHPRLEDIERERQRGGTARAGG
ncbi:MAG: carbamoyltransferase C-terminal domain-containing protein [Gemmataceae bacterium]